jgi:SAM-dependent MidA family methyltransferase
MATHRTPHSRERKSRHEVGIVKRSPQPGRLCRQAAGANLHRARGGLASVERNERSAPFGGAVESVSEVEEALRLAIEESGGRITYARFLEICLYHEARGYYAGFGPEGTARARAPAADYFTSVDLHPAYGELVAREVALHLDRVGSSSAGALWVVEFGAGRGLLARDILQALGRERPEAFARVRYLIIEPNGGWLAIQRRNLLPEFAAQMRWVRAAGPGVPIKQVRGAVLSNELFDALPFHVVEGSPDVGGAPPGASLVEVFVAAPEGRGGPLFELRGLPSDPGLALRLASEGVRLAPGQRAEVSLAGPALAEEIGRALLRGAVVAVDYGAEALDLYNVRLRPEGTMRCFYRHRRNDEPLARLGRQDITASVDFTALADGFGKGGLKVHPLERQREFLERHGLQGLLAKLEADQAALAREVYVRHRRALEALRDPKGLGGNFVLVAVR